MCLAQGPQRSDAGEAWTRGPSVSSQALYHWGVTFIKHIYFLYKKYYELFTNLILYSKLQHAARF